MTHRTVVAPAAFLVLATAATLPAQGPGGSCAMNGGSGPIGRMTGSQTAGPNTPGGRMASFMQIEQLPALRFQAAAAAARASLAAQQRETQMFWERAYQREQRIREARAASEEVKARRLSEKLAKQEAAVAKTVP